jgi:inosine-uridine nucleoside N-ribohydrolase
MKFFPDLIATCAALIIAQALFSLEARAKDFPNCPGTVVSTPRKTLPYSVPDEKRLRVIISSDAANEVDDQYAIVHALLTPQFIIKGIVAAHFRDRRPQSLEKSYVEIVRLLELTGFKEAIPALRGAAKPLANETNANASEGADLIVREAMADDSHPLYVICFGPLTDVASAYLQHPEIAGRLTVVWSGGGAYPAGGWEYNLSSDPNAANVVFQSPINFWQVPANVYSQVRVGTAELFLKVKPCGKIGDYLVENMMRFNEAKKDSKGWPRGEDWTLGDSPAISLLMNTNAHTDFFDMIPAPRIGADLKYGDWSGTRKIRVYNHVDGRVVLEDMFAKLQLNFGKPNQ